MNFVIQNSPEINFFRFVYLTMNEKYKWKMRWKLFIDLTKKKYIKHWKFKFIQFTAEARSKYFVKLENGLKFEINLKDMISTFRKIWMLWLKLQEKIFEPTIQDKNQSYNRLSFSLKVFETCYRIIKPDFKVQNTFFFLLELFSLDVKSSFLGWNEVKTHTKKNRKNPIIKLGRINLF